MAMMGSFVDPTDGEEPSEWEGFEPPRSAKMVVALIICAMSTLWLVAVATKGDMLGWGVSSATLRAGRLDTILLHMAAHASAAHLVMNMTALYSLGGILIVRMGGALVGTMRFALLFLFSGLAGATVFVAIHPFGTTPMVGASGAICGLLGLFLRLKPEGYDLHPLFTTRMRTHLIDFLKGNLWLIAFLTVPALLLGEGGGVAWEAHLGGLLFGLLVGPYLMPEQPDPLLGLRS